MTQNREKDRPFFIGIDVGFGDVKVAASGINGGSCPILKTFKFPTAVAPMSQYKSIGIGSGRRHYTYENCNYKIGRDALDSRNAQSTRELSFIIENAPLLVFKALEDVAAEYNKDLDQIISNPKTEICVGLPLKYFNEYKDQLINTLQRFTISGRKVNLEKKMWVIPQGYGVLMDFMFGSKENEVYQDKTLMILDVGFNTVDILCVSRGDISSEYSKTLTGWGVCWLVNDFRENSLLREMGIAEDLDAMPEADVKEIIGAGKVEIMGQTHDLTAITKDLSTFYVKKMMREVQNRVGDFMRKSVKLVVAGGGAVFVSEELYRQNSAIRGFVQVVKEPEYSNARGYLTYLNHKK